MSEPIRGDQNWIDEWNRLHCLYTLHGAKLRNQRMAEFLEDILPIAKEYYYKGDPIMSDKRFDMWEDWLRDLKPESKILQMIGF